MKENHIAYKISRDATGLVCSQLLFEEDKMLDLLTHIGATSNKGLYWVFKQSNGKPQEALCIIDCEYQRIYFHHSGYVEPLEMTIQKLQSSVK